MSKHFSAKNKLLLIERIKNGKSVTDISRESGVSRKTLYSWMHVQEESKTRAKKLALLPKNPKGKEHWKAVSILKERAVVKMVVKNTSLSIRTIANESQLSTHGVWNILKRNNLLSQEDREQYIYTNSIKILHEKTISQKLAMISFVEQGREVSDVCKEFGVSRKTYYKWYKRYHLSEKNTSGLESKRQRGEKHWRSIPFIDKLIQKIVILHPEFTAAKISNEIFRRTGKKLIGAHGAYNVLKRMQLTHYELRLNYASAYAQTQPNIALEIETYFPKQTSREGYPSFFKYSYSKSPITRNMFVFSVMLLIIVDVFLLGSIIKARYFSQLQNTKHPAFAKEPSGTINKPLLTSQRYTVVAGDDLWDISEKFYRSGYNWVDIGRANHLENPGILYVGEQLIIPAVSSSQPTENIAKVNQQDQITHDDSAKIAESTYIVQKGDDLWHIALRAYGNGDRWVDIARVNHLIHPSIIHIGNVITIPR